MKTRFLIMFTALQLLCNYLTVLAQEQSSIPFTLVSYNCENLFDTSHDTLKMDEEFLPTSEKRWTRKRYIKKVNDIGRVIHQCGGKGADWRLPDVVVLLEVENESTLQMLTGNSMINAANYRFTITHSHDLRGVDVAMLYNPLTFRLLEQGSLSTAHKEKERPTRDVLYVKGTVRNNTMIHIFAIHAPSRAGGKSRTEGYRLRVAERVNAAIDSIRRTTPDANIIIAGDLNDYSNDKSIKKYTSNGFTEISREAVGLNFPFQVLGTYSYRGKWESLDHILLSPTLATKAKACFILDNEWMLQGRWRNKRKPNRTYLGNTYNGGVSDHLPLVLHMDLGQ